MRCERHSQAAIDDDIIEGIGYYGLRKLLEPYGDIGYAVGTEMNRDGTPRIDVRFYNLRSSQENER